MKLLHLTDLHFNQRWFDWAAHVAPNFDAVAVSGDLLNRNCGVPIDRQIAWVSNWALNFPAALILCSGLDDIDGMKRAHWLESLARSQLTVDRGATRLGEWTAEAVPWFRVPAHGGDQHVIVTHVGPTSVAPAILWPENEDGGDERLNCHLRRTLHPPAIVLCGSVHCSADWWGQLGRSWVFNPGVREFGAGTPNYIAFELEPGLGRARWISGNLSAEMAFLRQPHLGACALQ